MNASLILLAMWVAGAPTAGESAPQPTDEEIRARTGQTSAVLKYETEFKGKSLECAWNITARNATDGLHVVVSVGDERTEFDVFLGRGIGRVLDLNVKLHHLKGEDLILGGVASLNSEDQIEYRMFVKRGKEFDPKYWAISDRLIVRPFEDPAQGMSLSFPGGDSVMLGLHSLSRGRDRVDSHFFINHCPGSGDNGSLLGGTDYFSCTVNSGETLTEFQLPVQATP